MPTPAADGFELSPLSDDVTLFRLDRPAKLNALTKAMLDGLAAALDSLEGSRTRVLIITGSGDRGFCAGTDLAEIRGIPAPARSAKNTMARERSFGCRARR
ncbi:MAG: enoyl-CoA hydratase/isomerase family protein [Burkholderiaceae bacterium]